MKKNTIVPAYLLSRDVDKYDTQYIECDMMTIQGVEQAEKLQSEGWDCYHTSIFRTIWYKQTIKQTNKGTKQ